MWCRTRILLIDSHFILTAGLAHVDTECRDMYEYISARYKDLFGYFSHLYAQWNFNNWMIDKIGINKHLNSYLDGGTHFGCRIMWQCRVNNLDHYCHPWFCQIFFSQPTDLENAITMLATNLNDICGTTKDGYSTPQFNSDLLPDEGVPEQSRCEWNNFTMFWNDFKYFDLKRFLMFISQSRTNVYHDA